MYLEFNIFSEKVEKINCFDHFYKQFLIYFNEADKLIILMQVLFQM